MNYLGLTLLWCAIQVTIFAVVSAVLYLSMRRRSPAARSTVLAASLISVILLTGLAWSPWPRWVPENSLDPQAASSVEPLADRSEIDSSVADSNPVEAPQVAEVNGPSSVLFLEKLWDEMKRAPVQEERHASAAAWTWQSIVAWLFLAVFALGMLRLISGILAVRRYRSHSHPIDCAELNSLLEGLQSQLECRRPIALRMSQEVTSPATIGWRRPIILLPLEWEEWNRDERTAVIAHEVAHIKRFDFPAWFAAQVGVVLHFYHPIVHWLAARLRLEQELAADAAAAEVLGGNSSYLSTLAGMALRRDDRSVSWAARTFLPSRHTFIRRIEMLRRRKVLDLRLSTVGRALLAGLMLAAAVFAAGWRSPFEAVAVAQQQSREKNEKPSPDAPAAQTEFGSESADGRFGATSAPLSKQLSLAYVPRDSLIVMAARPSVLLSQPVFAPIKKALDEQGGLQELFGIDVRNLVQVTLASLPEERLGMADDPSLILHFREEFDQEEFLKKSLSRWEEKNLGTLKYYESRKRNSCAFPNSRTAIFAQKPGDVIRILAAGEKGAANANWIEAWNRVSNSQAAALLDLERMRLGIKQEMTRGPQAALMGSFSPIWEDGKRLVWGANADETLSLQLFLECEEGKAEGVKETINATLVLARNGLSALRAEVAREGGKEALMAIKAADLADEVIDQTKIEVEGNYVTGSVTLGEGTADIVAFMVPAIQSARTAAKRSQSMNNMKQIGLAMHNYHDVYNRLPPAVVMGPDGKTPHSWRVELLPFLDNAALYNEYRMTEPWDSEHNKKVLEEIPDVFRCPMDDSNSINTSYFTLTGKRTSFEGTEGMRFSDFTDGLSNTIMVVESKKAVPWTKPDDIPIDFDKELPKFGGWYQGGFNALLCDGAVRFIAESMDNKVLKMLITRNGGEAIPRD